jgi:hypothetical protein
MTDGVALEKPLNLYLHISLVYFAIPLWQKSTDQKIERGPGGRREGVRRAGNSTTL